MSLLLGKKILLYLVSRLEQDPYTFHAGALALCCLPVTPPNTEGTLCICFLVKSVILELKISVPCQGFQMAESSLSHVSVPGRKENKNVPTFQSLNHACSFRPWTQTLYFWTWLCLACYAWVKTFYTWYKWFQSFMFRKKRKLYQQPISRQRVN